MNKPDRRYDLHDLIAERDALQSDLKIQDEANEILTRNNSELQAEVERLRKVLLSISRYTFAGPDTPERRESVHAAAREALELIPVQNVLKEGEREDA